MNPPGFLAYLFGSRLTCPLFLILAGYILYVVQTNPPNSEVEILVLIVFAMAIIVASLKTFLEVHRYERWKKEWNNVAEDPKEKAQRKRDDRRNNLLIMGLFVWCGLAYYLYSVSHRSDPQNYNIILVSFVVINLVAILWLFIRLRPRIKARQAIKEKNYVVSVFLPVPGNSPELQKITECLPSYCQLLLKP